MPLPEMRRERHDVHCHPTIRGPSRDSAAYRHFEVRGGSCDPSLARAGVAQMVEQRIRNAWVGGSNPFTGTNTS